MCSPSSLRFPPRFSRGALAPAVWRWPAPVPSPRYYDPLSRNLQKSPGDAPAEYPLRNRSRSPPRYSAAADGICAVPGLALHPQRAFPRNAAWLLTSHFRQVACVSASCPVNLPPPAVPSDSRIETLESKDPVALPILRLFFGRPRPSVSPFHPNNLPNRSHEAAAPVFRSPERNNSGTSKPAAPTARSFPWILLKYLSVFPSADPTIQPAADQYPLITASGVFSSC